MWALMWLSLAPAFALESKYTIHFYQGIKTQKVTDPSLFNPDNVAGLSSNQTTTDIRPFLEFSHDRKVDVVLRPRMRVVFQDQPRHHHDDNFQRDLYVREAFLRVRPIDDVELAVGRQNYQWGPAESVGPSNIFFPQLLFRIEPYYEVRGRNMARANVSFGGEWNLVTMAELPPPDDNSYDTQAELVEWNFHRALAKLERSWDNGAKYLGVVAAYQERGEARPGAGLYGAWTTSEAWQFYTDVLFQKGRGFLAPIGTGLQNNSRDGRYYYYGVTGLRYTFEGGTELRAEAILNQGAYSLAEQRRMKDGLKNPLGQAAFLLAGQQPGMALPGRSFLYLALRGNDAGTWLKAFQQPLFGLRALVSGDDGSSFVFTTFEAGLSDSLTLYAFAGSNTGPINSVFRRYLDHMGGLTLRWSL